MNWIHEGLMEHLPATVTVSGVVMEVKEDSVSCIGGVSVFTKFIKNEKDDTFIVTEDSSITCTDISGRFSISEVVRNSRMIPIAFQIDKYKSKVIEIHVSPETNEQNVSVIIQLYQ